MINNTDILIPILGVIKAYYNFNYSSYCNIPVLPINYQLLTSKFNLLQGTFLGILLIT